MDILVIGGTQFVGRAIVEAALPRGHALTLYHRGRTNAGRFDGVQEILGDRDGGLAALGDRAWDAVVDTCGYVPRLVRSAGRAVLGRTGCYAFVSTISVYDDPAPGTDENGPLHRADDTGGEEVNRDTYGPLKVACEREVLGLFPTDSLLIRPGVVVGPHDPTDRFTYWPVRFARGGSIAVPANGDAPIQFVDGRDLGAWVVHALEAGLRGPFNVVGPETPLTFGSFLDTCRREAAPPDTELVLLPDDFLQEQDVPPFVGLPFWLPAAAGHGLLAVDHRRARAAGLTYRPLADTLRDTLEWHVERGEPGLKNGLPAGKEEALLRTWRARQRPRQG
jgi:nucleoside-diphosphate-sugar epimerase